MRMSERTDAKHKVRDPVMKRTYIEAHDKHGMVVCTRVKDLAKYGGPHVIHIRPFLLS